MSSERPIDRLLRMFSSAPDPMTFSVEQMRKGTEAIAIRNPPSEDISITETSLAGIKGAWIEAPGARTDHVILYIHGGAFVAGSWWSHRGLVGEFSRSAQARVFAIDYRLAPENPFPAGLDDCFAVYKALSSEGLIERFAMAGDSAGAGLALSTVLRAREESDGKADAVVLFSPWLDLTCSSGSHRLLAESDPLLSTEFLKKMAALYLADTDPNDPAVSPLLSNHADLPPVLVQVGEREVLLDDAELFEARAKVAGVDIKLQVWPDMFHVWHGYTSILPEAKNALSQAGAFLDARWRAMTATEKGT